MVVCKGGKVNFNATGLCKYNGTWWYVSGGKVNFNATGLCKYNGSWWYVSSGRVNFNATGLCKYNGWWYINNGVVNFNKNNTLQIWQKLVCSKQRKGGMGLYRIP